MTRAVRPNNKLWFGAVERVFMRGVPRVAGRPSTAAKYCSIVHVPAISPGTRWQNLVSRAGAW